MNENTIYEAQPETVSGSEMIENDIQFNGTGVTDVYINAVSGAILKELTAEYNFSITKPFSASVGEVPVANPYPVICLIGGAGGNGKDTFIRSAGRFCSLVNLSTIDPVREAADVLIDYSHERAADEKAHKTDAYRTFLNDLKAAWVRFVDGPAVMMYEKVSKIVTTMMTDGEQTDVIFIHVREANEVDKMRAYFKYSMGLPVITMALKGLVDPSSYTNPGDAESDMLDWDLVVENTPGYPQFLEMQAALFAQVLIKANHTYGIPMNEAPKMDLIETARNDVAQDAQTWVVSDLATDMSYAIDDNVSIYTSGDLKEENKVEPPSPFRLDGIDPDSTASD